jgi:CRP-like cAMP-binding protein
MEQLKQAMRQMINISEHAMSQFLARTKVKNFKRLEVVSRPDTIPNDIFFICKGLIRVLITDHGGTEHTVHFALENQFISDYSNFMRKQNSFYTLQALEETQLVVLPRSAESGGT